MTTKKCIYCGHELDTTSDEHVIQNALGGALASTKICCGPCNNNQVSLLLDKPFVNIFAPITSGIPSFAKQKNKKSVVGLPTVIEFNGEKFDGCVREGKIVSCPELSARLKKPITEIDGLKISGYKFDVKNDAFKNGLSKIAMNYALHCDIPFNEINHGIHMEKSGDKIKYIYFTYPVLPFVPLNPLDSSIELTSLKNLTHNLILFNERHQLWCYIDLFNTFQYYVLLSENFDPTKKVYKTYSQKMQKNQCNIDTNARYRIDEIYSIAMQYGVEPTYDLSELKRRIDSKPRICSLDETIKTEYSILLHNQHYFHTNSYADILLLQNTINLYFNTNVSDKYIKDGFFRVKTLNPANYEICSYPNTINNILKNNPDIVRNYTTAKFERINIYLLENQK